MPFNRLTASLLLVVLAGVVGLGFLLSELYKVLDEDQPSSDNQVYQLLGGQLAATIGAAEDPSFVLQQAKSVTGFELALIPRSELPLPDSLMQALSAGEPLMLQSEGADNHMALSVYFDIPASDQLLVIDNLPVEEVQKADGTRLLLTLAFYAGLFGVVLMWLAPLVRRLTALRKVTRAFGQGELEQRLDSKGSSYIAAIESDFNQMADKIQDLMADNRLLSRAVSHDLKTPLARLRFGVEMLSQDLGGDNRQKYSERVERDLDEMESLVTTLLDYARMEDHRPTLNFTPLDLNQFTAQLIADHTWSIGIKFSSGSPSTLVIQADKRYLSMLMQNLINNACQHAHSRVLVSVRQYRESVIFSVEDDGGGIPAIERSQVLKPFVRLDSRKDGGVKGHGMGLAIVQRLATWHGARVVLGESAELGGAKAEVVFQF